MSKAAERSYRIKPMCLPASLASCRVSKRVSSSDQSCSISIFWFQYQYQYFLDFVFNININTNIKISLTCNINTNINTGGFIQYQYQNFENLQNFDQYQYFFDKSFFLYEFIKKVQGLQCIDDNGNTFWYTDTEI